jgi:hypothetical protein
MAQCTEPGCDGEATYMLHIPWAENRPVCAGHARSLARQDGVVADALESASDGLPDGAANREE